MNRFCTACGKAIDADTIFCGSCGKRVRREGTASTPSSTDIPTASDSTVTQRKYPAPSGMGRRPLVADEPPEGVFARAQPEAAFGKPMNSSASPAALGDPMQNAQGYYEGDAEASSSGRLKWILIASAVALLLFGAFYYWLFLSDDSRPSGKPLATTAETEKVEEAKGAEPVGTQYYVMSSANIRDNASSASGKVTGKLARGDSASGDVITGEDGKEWLKLSNEAGFVFMANLSKEARPTLAQNFGRRSIKLASSVELLSAPGEEGDVIESLSKGLTISLSGITGNDYAEVILKKGGVGYIANGAALVKAGGQPSEGKAIALKLDNNGCPAGSEVSALFAQVNATRQKAIDAAEAGVYETEEAKAAAIEKANYGGSTYLKVNRRFEGLTIVGVAQHLESQSVYFAESPETVRAKFRELGYTVGSDGTLTSEEIAAGISGNRDSKASGKTDLQCGT